MIDSRAFVWPTPDEIQTLHSNVLAIRVWKLKRSPINHCDAIFIVISALKYCRFPDFQFFAPQQCNCCFTTRSCLGWAWTWRVMYNDFYLLKLWCRWFLSQPALHFCVQIKLYFIYCIQLQTCTWRHHNIVSWGFSRFLDSPGSMLLLTVPTLKYSTFGDFGVHGAPRLL